MPSKGGRRSGTGESAPAVVSGPPVARSREQWDAAGFAVAEMAQPVRRGIDVARLNELAGRETELPPDEADELYRLRIRRVMSRLCPLARARTRGDEESIRAALDDLDDRLGELRRLEESHRETGLAAGGDDSSPQPTGDVRLPAVAFRASDNDVPVYILAPPSLPSEALARNVEAVAHQGANLRLIHDPSEIRRDAELPPLVLNWGGSESLPADLVTLNRPDAVRIAADQVESVRRLGELAPRTVLRPDDLPLLGSDRVVAKRRHGARGSGKAVIGADAPWSERARYDLFQRLIGNRIEYRLGVLSGHVVSAYRKDPPAGTEPENLRPEWRHEQVQVVPAAVASVAREAARRIWLDYAGVDVIVDRDTGRAHCLEANAAPGMSEQTLRSLYANLQRTVRGRLARAS